MLAVQKTKPEPGAALAEVPVPAPARGEVLVAVKVAGICGSDLHAERWTPSYAFMAEKLPVTLGHEFSGVVAALGEGVSDIGVGDRVTVWPAVACGHCAACRLDEPHNCERKSTVGLHRDGGFADCVAVPARNVFKLPDAVDFELGALTEPLTVAAHAIATAGIRLGQSVVVLGPGPIGLGVAWLARLAGALPVILCGFDDRVRLDRAGAVRIRHVVDLRDASLSEAVGRIAGGKVDHVIEASGAAQSIADGLGVLKMGGVLTAVGIHARPVELDLTAMVRAKHQLRTSHDSRRDTWPRVLDILAANGDEIRGMITHRLPMHRALEGFAIAHQGAAVKVLLTT